MIVGIAGRAGVGKDTAAAMLRAKFGAYVIAQADPMKEFCRTVFGFSEEQLYGPSSCRNAEDVRYPRPDRVRFAWCRDDHTHGPECGDPVYLTPREALQKLGTEWGRAMYRDTWIDLALRRARTILDGGFDPVRGVVTGRVPFVVISDVRFANELAAIQRANGFVIRLRRPGAELGGAAGAHASEAEQDAIPDGCFDAVAVNDGTLDDLEDAVLGAAHMLGIGQRVPFKGILASLAGFLG